MISIFILILLLLLSTMSFLPGVQRLITNALGITSDGSNDAGSSAPGDNSGSHNSASGSNTDSSQPGNGYEPSALDVVVVKSMLTRGLGLPHEIVLSLLDHAEYWPHTTTTLDHSLTVSSGQGREDQFVVSSAHQPYGLVFTDQHSC